MHFRAIRAAQMPFVVTYPTLCKYLIRVPSVDRTLIAQAYGSSISSLLNSASSMRLR